MPRKGAPAAASNAAAITRALAEALEGRSKAEVAAAANVSRSALYSILAGQSWPDMVVVGELGRVLGVDLLRSPG